jgi:hypothetical protein
MRKLVAVNLIGGLGNQMFQYSIGIILQLENNIKVKFDLDFFKIKEEKEGYKKRNLDLDVFDVEIEELTKQERNYFLGSGKLIDLKRLIQGQPVFFNESELGFKNDWSVILHNTYYFGYFQKYEFYKGYENILMETFKFNTKKISQKALELSNRFGVENAVSLHIRKGDYVNDNITKSVFFNLDIEYYNSAMVHLSQSDKNLKFYVFSDDIKWVVENFNPKDFNYEIVELNNPENAWEDMFLMTKCKHNIIANSTFSWWGAFLNQNPLKKVIAPKNWYYDMNKNQNAMKIYPEKWILI